MPCVAGLRGSLRIIALFLAGRQESGGDGIVHMLKPDKADFLPR